jgi:2,4-dienoyl-CoA reductase-like NADH-dependent reductase (Old Yellow Enzyme family)
MQITKIASLKTPDDFRQRLNELGLSMEFDATVEAAPNGPLAQSFRTMGLTLGNRFAILPMEGWDADRDGSPSDLVRRRWNRFGQSGAKLIWGGEAVAVRADGRANPHQLILNETTVGSLGELRQLLLKGHAETMGSADDVLVGLQLTHSGRFARPNDKKQLEPRIAYRHPLLDARFGIDSDRFVFTDLEIAGLIEAFVQAAVLAQKAGFHFVDVKHCHGYLGHEFLTAHTRPGRYGGSLENRMRFGREIIEGIRREAPGLGIGIRLSVFDQLPFQKGPNQIGVPMSWSGPYPFAFGANPECPTEMDLREPIQFLQTMNGLGVELACLTAGSPYYNPHIQRPAIQPPSDGYLPPEDPLVGVDRQVHAVAAIKQALPQLGIVGSAYSYLQEWLPNVAQAQVRAGHVDFVGLGRMVLSYPELPADALAGRPLQRRRICRTFSDCTTGPRNGLVSGCFPLDDFYKSHPDAAVLKASRS